MPFTYDASRIPEWFAHAARIAPSNHMKLAGVLAELLGRGAALCESNFVIVVHPHDFFHFLMSPGIQQLREFHGAIYVRSRSDGAAGREIPVELSIRYLCHEAVERDMVLMLGIKDLPLIFRHRFDGTDLNFNYTVNTPETRDRLAAMKFRDEG